MRKLVAVLAAVAFCGSVSATVAQSADPGVFIQAPPTTRVGVGITIVVTTLPPGATTTTTSTTTTSTSTTTTTAAPTTSTTSTTSTSTTSTSTSTTTTTPGDLCPAALNQPDGEDIFGGCWPGPLTTGVPAGTVLTTYTGPSTISTPGTVIDSKIINNCLDIATRDVVVRNSRITGDCTWTVDGFVTTGVGDWFLVEDSEITCFPGAQGGIGERGFVLRRSEIKGHCANNVDGDQDFLVEDSYLWDLPVEGAEEHGDGIQSCCSANITIRHNTILGEDASGGNTTSAIILPIAAPPPGPILVEKNLLFGGAFTLYCASTANQSIIQNVFGIGSHAPAFGHVDNCAYPTTFTGNVTTAGVAVPRD